jgi:hypothetical protein
MFVRKEGGLKPVHGKFDPQAVLRNAVFFFLPPALLTAHDAGVTGVVTDPQAKAVAGATVHIDKETQEVSSGSSDQEGRFYFSHIVPGHYRLRAEAPGFLPVTREVSLSANAIESVELQFQKLAAKTESVVITAKSLEPAIDFRNAEVFNRTLFTRDDQVLQQLNAGINAGQHEGRRQIS